MLTLLHPQDSLDPECPLKPRADEVRAAIRRRKVGEHVPLDKALMIAAKANHEGHEAELGEQCATVWCHE